MANPRYSPRRVSGVISSVARIGGQCRGPSSSMRVVTASQIPRFPPTGQFIDNDAPHQRVNHYSAQFSEPSGGLVSAPDYGALVTARLQVPAARCRGEVQRGALAPQEGTPLESGTSACVPGPIATAPLRMSA